MAANQPLPVDVNPGHYGAGLRAFTGVETSARDIVINVIRAVTPLIRAEEQQRAGRDPATVPPSTRNHYANRIAQARDIRPETARAAIDVLLVLGWTPPPADPVSGEPTP